jgi:hypothetical protein
MGEELDFKLLASAEILLMYQLIHLLLVERKSGALFMCCGFKPTAQ